MVTIPYPEPLSCHLSVKYHCLIPMVIERDGRYCHMCGQDETSLCPYDGIPISLSVALILPRSHGGEIIARNLRTICSTCADGLRALTEESGWKPID